ncbi:cytochrome P450 [Lentzea sp. NPDC051213]|uniref:cytochrome P450 n=1 Tax=Lentzea sp. NPDC051213 TaxID=3364126 RepID=UPI0037BA1786
MAQAPISDGPRSWPIVGDLPQFGRDPLRFFTTLAKRGPIVRWRFGRRPALFLSEPGVVAELFAADGATFDRPDSPLAFRMLLGNSVALASGEDWQRKRALVGPTLRPRQVRGYAATMVDCADDLVRDWRPGDRVDLKREMARLTQSVLIRAVFGGESTPAERNTMAEAVDRAQLLIGKELGGLGVVLPDRVPTPTRRRLARVVAEIDEVIRTIVARISDDGSSRSDLLSRLRRSDDGWPALSARELRDETVSLYVAGHETTSNALSWLWYLLARHPHVRDRMHAELDEVLAGRRPGIDDWPRLAYVRAVVQETMRIRPVAWMITTVAGENTVIGGHHVPRGTRLWCSPWVTHRDPRWWDDPEEFRPERWSGPVSSEAYFPFGSGPRGCPGTNFAMVESVLVVARLAQQHVFDVDPGEIRPAPLLTLQPKGPVMATVSSR